MIPEGYNKLTPSPQAAGYLWLLGSGGLQRSRDGGQSWAKVPEVMASEAIGFGKAAPTSKSVAVYLV